ncbi:YceI family protein [Streptomyces sp. NPDC050658]|uniref:YceI family protein n=1 Tax=unclassified Streptomyces TaxID=2593676 RepID=UPI003440387B
MHADLIKVPGYVAGTWLIDQAHSDVGLLIRHLMISKVRGHFTRFEGRIVTAEDPLKSEVTATVDMSSIDTSSAQRDEHLRDADFFEVERYPTMTYRSTRIRPDGDDFLVEGHLTLKGVTRPVPLRMEVNGFAVDPYGPDPGTGARAGFSVTGEINRMDFDVTYNGPIPGGGAALGEKVQIVMEIEAVLQPG